MRRIKFADDDVVYLDDMCHTIVLQFDNPTLVPRIMCQAPEHEDYPCRWYHDDPESGELPTMHSTCWIADWVEASGELMEYYAGPLQDVTRFMSWRVVWAANSLDGPLWRLLFGTTEVEVFDA